MKKRKLIEYLENQGVIDTELFAAAKHSRLKVLLVPMTIGSLDNPLVEAGRYDRWTSSTSHFT